MDEIEDFFDFSKPFQRVIVSSGYINARIVNKEETVDRIAKREDCNEDYAKLCVNAERQQILQSLGESSTNSNRLDDLDIDEDDDMHQPKLLKRGDNVYEKYNFEIRSNSDLPITESRENILKLIGENRVVILEGDTGCGKTTQVPQYIIEDAYRRKEYCNIICTQPRRIAAISIARRVCAERHWELGSIVGYQVGLHATNSGDTRLMYCTTGILLQKLIKTKDLKTYTHIILDEVHERDQDMDFLLIIIRRLLTTNSPNVKVILMSATINTNEFSDYFKIVQGGTLKPAPILKVDTRRLYTVKDFYLCQLERLGTHVEVNYDEPCIQDEMYKIALKLVVICETLDNQDEELADTNQKPSILIFLPGINEIEKMEKTFETLKDFTSKQCDINLLPIRLHSMISAEEQQKVFRRAPPNHRKVILSTNIAESSITVSDVKYVIDFCLTKELVTDTSSNLTALQLKWASRSNCKQRAGRAGRVMNGRVYRLVSKHFYDILMDEFGTPEMTRCPLENVVLKSKLLNMGAPHAILALAMTPPNLTDIRNTILVLKEAGALYKTVNGNYEIFDGDLTFVGRIMAALPIDIRISRLIVFGYIFSVLEETIIIGAGLNVKNIFEFPYNNRLAAYSQKLTWSDGSGSDLFAILKAYRVWCSMKEHRNFDYEDTEKSWARRYFINTRSMKEVHLLVGEIKGRLESAGVKDISGVNRVNWTEKEKTIVLKIVISGAFYPNYFIRSGYNQNTEREAFQSLSGLDPCNTVFFSGFDSKYIGQLYIESIKDLFKQCAIAAKNIEIRFCTGSQRVFVSFISDIESEYTDAHNLVLSVPGRVKTDVYKAIKMRFLKYPTHIKVMQPRDAVIYAENNNLGVMTDGKWLPKRRELMNPELIVIPSMQAKLVRGKITHIEHCGKFWFQPLSEVERLREITEELNGVNSDITPFGNPSEITKGQMLAAPFNDIGVKPMYHRARVVNLVQQSKSNICFRILFIDYGNYEVISYNKLRRFGFLTNRLKDLPPRVFECSLAEIQPSSINCPRGKWLDEAMEFMQLFVDKGIVEAEIYSVVNNIASVKLRLEGDNLNDLLIEKGFAQHSEENYMSKADHDFRMRTQRVNRVYEGSSGVKEDYLKCIYGENDVFVKSAPAEKCRIKIDLKGPFSPVESRTYSATRIGAWKSVVIENQSVNSVLLENDPQDCHEKLLVAASVSENVESNTLTARHTTLMPNIPGFSSLMGLIFCPTMEIRRNSHKTKYISILAGLGFDKNNKPIFEEHDIIFNLDVEITPNDLQLINQIRYSMDTLLYTESENEKPQITRNDRAEITAKIKHLIMKLLEKPRKYIEVRRDLKDHVWNQMHEEDILEPTNIYGDRSIFPFHCGLRLYSESFEHAQALRIHCEELHKLGQFDISIKPTLCQLCDQNLETITQLRIHLLSQLHRDREYQIGYNI